MKNLYFHLFTILFIGSCVTEEMPDHVEEEIVDPTEEVIRRGICDFDISDRAGTFDLYRTWEFAGFQNLNTKWLDNLTCMARVANFALNGEDYDKMKKITLNLNQEIEESGFCTDLPKFEASTFSYNFYGCFENVDGELSLIVSMDDREYVPKPESTTLPVLEFEENFLKAINAANAYQIEKNRLYLYGEESDSRMVFVALAED
jgi:hypothetical protein